jgi:hypothetical protein
MKTLKITIVLSIVLLLGFTIGFTMPAIEKGSFKPVIAARYHVSIHFTNDLSLCNLYLVEIVDENGRLVNPPQSFRPGISSYFFSERGPVQGTRIAKLVLNSEIRYFVCPTEIYTAPCSLSGTFLVGETYEFDLYPATHEIPPAPVPGGRESATIKD